MPSSNSASLTADEWQHISNQLADAARAATLPHFRKTGLTAENKDARGGYDPVTVADREAEQAMRAIVERLRPDDGILGEEFGAKPSRTGLTWVFDPVDGTRGFVSGTPTWGVLISVADQTGPIAGVIDQPYIGERFFGGYGSAWMEGPRGQCMLKSSFCDALDDAVIFTTFPEVGTPQESEAFRAVAGRCKLTRYGMDCYAYALLAQGTVDLVIEAGLNPYDIQAPIAVIEAAGGVVTDWAGGPAHEGGRVLAAANAALHAQALELLAKFSDG